MAIGFGFLLFVLSVIFICKGISHKGIALSRLEKISGKQSGKTDDKKGIKKLSFWGIMTAISNIVPSKLKNFLKSDLEKHAMHSGRSKEELLGVRIIAMIVLPLFALRIFGTAPFMFFIAACLVAAGYSSPILIANMEIERHLEEFRKVLPPAVDMLYTFVLGGKNLYQAFISVAAVSREPLKGEFEKTAREIEFGSPLAEALGRLEERCPLPELGLLLNSILESEKRGYPLSETLSVFSKELRLKRRDALKMRIAKAPIKLLAPLIFLILPASIILTVGPTFLVALKKVL